MDKINFLNKNTQQFWNYFHDQPLVQVKGLYGCQRGIEIEIQQEFQQEITLSQFLKESQKGNLIAIKSKNIILFCLILPELFFITKPISEKAIEIVLFRILHDLTDNIKICLNDNIYNDWYTGDVVPFSTKLLQRNDYDFAEETNKKVDVYTCNKYQIQQDISTCDILNSQTLSSQITIIKTLNYNDQEENLFLKSYQDFTFSLMLQLLKTQNSSIIQLSQVFKNEHQSEKLKQKLNALSQAFEKTIKTKRKELVQSILNKKKPNKLNFIASWDEKKEQNQAETSIHQIFSQLKLLETQYVELYFPEGFEEKYQKIVKESLKQIEKEQKTIHERFLNEIKQIFQDQSSQVKYQCGKINFKINRLNDNPEEIVANIWPILDEQKQIVDCNVLQNKASFKIKDVFQTKEKANIYIIETNDKTHIMFHQYKAPLFKLIRSFDLKETNSAKYFHDYNRNYLFIFNHKNKYVQQIIITNHGTVQDDRLLLYQCFQQDGKNIDFHVSQVAYLNFCNQFIVLTNESQVYRQQQQGQDFKSIQCLLNKDKISDYTDFIPSIQPQKKYKQLLSCPSGKYFYLANEYCCDRYDQSCLRIQSIKIQGQIKIFADFSDVIILDQLDKLYESRIINVISNLVSQKKFNKQQNDEKKVIGNPTLDITKGSFSKFGPNAQFLFKGKKKIINLSFDTKYFTRIEPYFNFMNLSEASINSQQPQLVECENRLIKNIAFSRIPLQLCTIENGTLVPLYDGFRQQNQAQTTTSVDQKVKQLHLGFFEDHLLEKENKIFVVGIIGKQSSGKSYLLNRVFGTRFSVSSARCTDGVWASIAYVDDQTFVVLDCEGLFNGARTEKEEIKMLAFLTAISDITILNSDLTFSRHLNDLFNNLVEASKQLNDDKLFKGILYIVLRDVSSSDNTGVDQELLKNLERLRQGGSEEIVFLNKLFNNKLAVEKLFNNENKLFDEQLVQVRNYFIENSIKSNRWKNGKELIQIMKILLCQLELSDNTNASLIDLQIRIEKIFQDSQKEWYEFSSNNIEQDNLKLIQSNYKFSRFEEDEYITFNRDLLTQLYQELELKDTISTHNSNLLESTNQLNQMMQLRKEQIISQVKSETNCIDNVEVRGMINKEQSLLETFLKDQIDQYQFCQEKCSECYLQCKHFQNHIDVSNKLKQRLQKEVNKLEEQFQNSKIKNTDQEKIFRDRIKKIEQGISDLKKAHTELINLQEILKIRNQLQEITNEMAKYDFYEKNGKYINLKAFRMKYLINKEKETIELNVDQIEELIREINNQVTQCNNQKMTNIEEIQANKSRLEKYQNEQEEIKQKLNHNQHFQDSSSQKKEDLIKEISQSKEQQQQIQDQIKDFDNSLNQNDQKQIELCQSKIKEENEKSDQIEQEIEEVQNNWNEIQQQIQELKKLSQLQFIQHFQQLRSVKDDLHNQNEENEENQKSLKQQKVEIDELKKKLEVETKKKQTKDSRQIIEATQKRLAKYDESNINQQIKKYEKEKEDLQTKEKEYNFDNMFVYEECMEEIQGGDDISIENLKIENFNQLVTQESKIQNQFNEQNQENIKQNSDEGFQQNNKNRSEIVKIDEEFNNNQNQEENTLEQTDFQNQIKQQVNDQEENINEENQNEEIIQQEQQEQQQYLDTQIDYKNHSDNLNEKKQEKINEKIMDLFFLKKQKELDEMQQEVDTQKQRIQEIQINIKSWNQQIQHITIYLKLIDTQKLLQSKIQDQTQNLKEFDIELQKYKLESQTLKQQLEQQLSQIDHLKGRDNTLQQQNEEIDNQIVQLNDRSDQLKTFQNYLIKFQTSDSELKYLNKQFYEWGQSDTFKNLTLQEVSKKVEEVEKILQSHQEELEESNNNLITFNQVETDSDKKKKLQNHLNQLNQQKLEVHSCLRESHKCDQVCQICPNKICDNKAGHDQKQEHLCSEQNHRCSGICDISDCQSPCMKSFKHDQQHNCQNDHPCKEKCKYCDKNCQKDRSIPHDNNHDCKEVYCTHNCSLCTRRCKDPHQKSKDKGHHFCDQKHYCQEKCDEQGICKIEYEIKEVTWKSSISEFQYIKYIPKDIGKQKCHLEIPPGELKHDGKHICKNNTEKQFHNCNQQCPECNTFCDLRYGHEGVHSSDRHRNKENQIFTQKEGNLQQIEIYDSKDTIRKYQIGDNSAPETCDQSCKRRGKAHFHLVECKGGNLCLEKNNNFKNKARHSKEKYVNFEKLNFDEVLCLEFWQLNKWAHPIQSEVNNIRRCNYYCPICLFQKKDYEFCEQEAWHTQDDKISSHGFFCSEEHKKNQIQGINIAFVLDTTGSMSSYINMCKDTIKNIMEQTKAQKNLNGEAFDVSFAVVSYKDHDPPYNQSQKILDIQDFTSDSVIIQFLNKLTADGGGDGPEAVLDGLDASFRLNWTDKYVKLLYLIADAPPHGKQYHNFNDSFPEGCPCKLNQNDILQKLLKKKLQFKILQLNQSINGMIAEFKKDFKDLEVVDPKNSNKENSFQNLIVGEVCKYLAHNEITYQMKK